MDATPVDDELEFVHAGMGGDIDTMLVFNLMRTHSYLAPFLDAGLRRKNLTSAQLNTLLILKSAGDDGMMMAEIGRRLVVTKPNVTGLIDRLERQGLVARSTNDDRRITTVRITDAGLALLEETTPRHARLIAELTGCFNETEKKTLIRLLTRLRRELRHRPGGK